MILTKTELQELKDKIRQKKGDRCYLHLKYHNTVLTGSEHRQNTGREFDLEHINNDRTDYSEENLDLACHSCNVRKMHEHQKELMELGKQKTSEHKLLYMSKSERGREEGREEGSSWDADGETVERMSPEMKKSEIAYRKFKEYAVNRVSVEGRADYEDLLFSSMHESGIKEKAGRSYMKIIASSAGAIRIIEENKKPRWVVMRDRTKSKEVRA